MLNIPIKTPIHICPHCETINDYFSINKETKTCNNCLGTWKIKIEEDAVNANQYTN